MQWFFLPATADAAKHTAELNALAAAGSHSYRPIPKSLNIELKDTAGNIKRGMTLKRPCAKGIWNSHPRQHN
jgi:hypothetical protein